MAYSSKLTQILKPLIDAGSIIYEVGGPVRDYLLNTPPSDYDILCTKLSIDSIISLLQPYGKIAHVGKSFGILKFSPHQYQNYDIDIALPRTEISTGTGHSDFNVHFDKDLPVEVDLGRRDFTINAMALNICTGEIIDPYNGQADLKNKILRIVFDNAFLEDPLRLMRGIQFAARLGFTFDDNTWQSMITHSDLINTVSPERISLELVKLMHASKPSIGIDLMANSHLLTHILPDIHRIRGIKQDKQPGDDVYGHTMRVLDAAASDPFIDHKGNLELLFAALLHDIGKAKTARIDERSGRIAFFGHQIVSARLAKKWMKKIRLDSAGINLNEIETLVENHMFETKSYYSERAIRRFIAKIGKDLIFKLVDLRLSDNRGGKHPNSIKGVLNLRKRIHCELDKKPPFGPKDLAINGNDIMLAGINEGPQIGRILAQLVEIVLDDPTANSSKNLLAIVKKIADSH